MSFLKDVRLSTKVIGITLFLSILYRLIALYIIPRLMLHWIAMLGENCKINGNRP